MTKTTQIALVLMGVAVGLSIVLMPHVDEDAFNVHHTSQSPTPMDLATCPRGYELMAVADMCSSGGNEWACGVMRGLTESCRSKRLHEMHQTDEDRVRERLGGPER